MTALLDYDKYFIQFQIDFATEHGLNEAIIAGKMQRLERNLTGQTDEAGAKWVRMTLEEWAIELPFWSVPTIHRAIASCVGKGIFLSRTFTGRSKWYRLNPDFVASPEAGKGPPPDVSDQNDHIPAEPMRSKRSDVSDQNDQLPTILTYNPLNTSTNVEVEAVASPAVKSKPIPEKPKTPGPKTLIMQRFCELAGMQLPTAKKDKGFWWGRVNEIYNAFGKDTEAALKGVAAVVGYMLDEGLTITGPQSIVNLCRTVASGQQLKRSKHNATYSRRSSTKPARVGVEIGYNPITGKNEPIPMPRL